MVAETFHYYAGMPERLLGDTIPVSGGVDVTFREPLGVVGLIVPWNFPLTIASWKMAPALAAGNTLVLKPAELPLSDWIRAHSLEQHSEAHHVVVGQGAGGKRSSSIRLARSPSWFHGGRRAYGRSRRHHKARHPGDGRKSRTGLCDAAGRGRSSAPVAVFVTPAVGAPAASCREECLRRVPPLMQPVVEVSRVGDLS